MTDEPKPERLYTPEQRRFEIVDITNGVQKPRIIAEMGDGSFATADPDLPNAVWVTNPAALRQKAGYFMALAFEQEQRLEAKTHDQGLERGL